MPKTRRALAWFVDFSLVVAAACGLAVFTFHRISALMTDVPDLTTMGGWDVLTSRGDVLRASADLGLSLWDRSVRYVEEAFGLVVLAAFVYQWASLALAGRTVGKALAGLKVTRCPPRTAALRAAVTTTADVAVYALSCVLLVEGQFLLSGLVWLLSVAVFLANALPVLSPEGRSLADRVAGTAVRGEAPRLSTPAARPPVRTF